MRAEMREIGRINTMRMGIDPIMETKPENRSGNDE